MDHEEKTGDAEMLPPPDTNDHLAWALWYARHGWRVLPLRPRQKIPLTEHGLLDASADESVIRAWWSRWPDANVGLAMRSSGLLGIDVDSHKAEANGHETLAKLEVKYGAIPDTVEAETPGGIAGGRHLILQHPETSIVSYREVLGLGLDVRDDAYIVAPPSIHACGKRYVWRVGHEPNVIAPAVLPEWLLKRLTPKEGGRRGSHVDDPDTPINRILQLLPDAHPGSKGWKALCPAHDDNDPSLSISEADDGRVLINCFAGCATEDVARALGIQMRDLFPPLTVVGGKGKRLAGEGDCLEARKIAVGAARAGVSDGSTVLPTIVVEGGALSTIVDAAEGAMLAWSGFHLYQRGGLIVRAIRTEAVTVADGVTRTVGAQLIVPVEVPYLVEQLTLSAEWQVADGRKRGSGYKRIDCPKKVAETYMARRGRWNLPLLVGIIEAPTLRPDGSILELPGYDPATGLLFVPGDTTFDRIPPSPGRDEAMVALEVLRRILDEFPFVHRMDEAAALAAILTALIRRSVRAAPMHGFRAPKMRSGKTMLADIVSMLATGRPCAVMSQASRPEDESKRLFAVLLAGDPVICYDNIDRPFGGAAISQALTQSSITDRVLGLSKSATVPTTSTFLATGNNLTFDGDITSRVLTCDLDPAMERPEERSFKRDLYKEVPRDRGRLVPAGLTILRAYHVAGRPDQGLPRWAGFDGWSDWIRSALVWAGMPDPCETRRRIEEQDPVRRALTGLLTAWHEHLGETPVTAAEVVKEVTPPKDGPAVGPGASALHDALHDAVARRDGISTRVLGNYLQAHAMRIENALRIERVGNRSGVALWRVTRLPERG